MLELQAGTRNCTSLTGRVPSIVERGEGAKRKNCKGRDMHCPQIGGLVCYSEL